ncbi:MAG: hypothetical protein ACYTBJ_01790 [Planctomycetota bacterium]|jgi:hypothetical protein
MEDLIYASDEAIPALKEKYPSALFADASDMVHEERFSIVIPDKDFDQREYYRFMIREGLALVSLNIQLAMRVSGKQHDMLMELVDSMPKKPKD